MTTVVSNAHKTKPAKYQDIDDSDFADQAGWRYPCDTEAHCRAALAYIQKPNDQQQYTPETLAKIKAFIKKKAKAFGIDVAAFAELSHNDTRDKVAAALGIDGYWIHDLYGDDAAGTAIHRKIKLAGKDYEDDGKLYSTPYTIANGAVTLGDHTEVTRRTVYEPVVKMTADFSCDVAPESVTETVLYSGKVFQTGEYPDKDFALSDDEAMQAVAAFTPVSNDYEHHDGFLDGKLGTLKRVWKQGADLYAEMEIPKAIRDLAGTTLQASLTWARDTKKILGCALTSTPRITDATLTAAFTAHSPQKEFPMSLYDKIKTLFTGKEPTEAEITAVLKADPELAASFAANLDFPTNVGGDGKKAIAKEPDEDDETEDEKAERLAKRKAAKQAKMTASAPAPAPVVEDPVITGLKASQLRTNAEAMFSDSLGKGKVTPAAQAPFVALYSALHKADNAGIVTFSTDGSLKNGEGVKALADFMAVLPDNPALFQEMLETEAAKGNILTFSTPKGGDGKPTAERSKKLRALAGLPEKH